MELTLKFVHTGIALSQLKVKQLVWCWHLYELQNCMDGKMMDMERRKGQYD